MIARNDEVAFSSLDGHMVALHVANGRYHSIDEIGTRIWAMLESPCRVAEICDEMQAVFDIDRAQCEQDVLDFLRELAGRDMLRMIG